MNADMENRVELVSDSIVDRVYEQLKAMAVSYQFKPGERLNEGELAKRLGVSRTPLREALNRLNTEGFLRFTPGRGFFCRELDAHEIFDLYELRKSIEIASICVSVLEKHIDRRLDRITSAIKEGYAQIYMPAARAAAN
jgi:DNA-binding GntR family transcriptional regulator